ncbi:FecR family protein [Pedobacter sp. AW1-32]|uniref:FecR family protein n=1 Tax=Pedobacter sp. AW1-32 TaxID=3383026 RepID=UPI003FF0D9EE
MNTEQLKQLLKKYQEGKATAKETFMVEAFVAKELAAHEWTLPETEKMVFGAQLKARILAEKDNVATTNGRQNNVKRLWTIVTVAAAVIIAIVLIAVYKVKLNGEKQAVRFANDVAPGKNSAIFITNSGKRINLDEQKNGSAVQIDGIIAKKEANGILTFAIAQNAGKLSGLNRLETPQGGQYQVNLPDGTQVWLNSSSSLTFPSQFNGLQRHVQLSGEAYFEVAKDKKHPFMVQTINQEIEVLGTHFNVNSYVDEAAANTTLLEGAVKVTSGNTEITIKPGQNAMVSKSGIHVSDIDPNLAVDWKNGEFRFKNEELPSILRKLSRWYGVTFINQLPKDKIPAFTGSVSRFDHISKVLNMLEKTANIQFTINGKTITVN